ncbi:TetR/AcrR family transcriptional regulator [Rhodococcus sp. KBS0724]|uniref:TetR/AcrR family transcriptional regulator n=1 Tax=Rhodococcus sp. KBS0724 TaxID=1179674 RepID=UPI0021B13375|nr:TetR/AcrR family transcriptional regulator [Rhodococcus sp. KBS0724]
MRGSSLGRPKSLGASGYSAASINDVIVCGGLTKGGLFHHFPSKQSIAQQLVVRWSRSTTDLVVERTARGVRG